MKPFAMFGLAALLVLPAVSCAQERRPQADDHDGGPKAGEQNLAKRLEGEGTQVPSTRRLETVTWNSVKHELTWVISNGDKKQGATYQATGSANYEINMDNATMSVGRETRRFSRDEAANVHVVMDIIAKYAIDSTIWWDDGQGEPVVPGSEKEPQKDRRERQRPGTVQPDGSSVLHVAYRPAPAGAMLEAVDARIQQLERKLDELKQLRQELNASDTAVTY